jgi:diguanylate cyclase (GGDEF)-like protein
MRGAAVRTDARTVTWAVAGGLNALIAVCYVLISSLILLGLTRTQQLSTNPLAVATAAIFLTCAMHHGHHAVHLLTDLGGAVDPGELAALRAVFGEWHTAAIDAVGAVVALTYLGLRRSYKALLNTPAMFDDAVRVAAEARLRELAFTDLLTGVPNRAAYQQHADARSGQTGPSAVLFVDLDGFKGVNDRHGHDTGDRVLREVAQRVAAGLRPPERLFRLGGDEFVVVAADYDLLAAEALAERTRASISRPVAVTGEQDLVVSGSVGVAAGGPGEGVDELLRRADLAMYAVKSGRTVGAVPGPRPLATRVQAGQVA